MTSQVKAYRVDAFTCDNYGGSLTGVVLDTPQLTDEQLQKISNKIACTHTAFIFEPTGHQSDISVRFFTPGGEILNCGHGTIAAHYTRVKVKRFFANQAFFQRTKEGIQQVELVQHHDNQEIWLQQNEITFASPGFGVVDELLHALHIDRNELDDNFPIILASPGSYRFLVAVTSTEELNKIAPDFVRLARLCGANNSMGCFVYSIDKTSHGTMATARMFASNIGVNEDAINGNSSGCLGAYLLALNGDTNLNLSIIQGQKFNKQGLVKVNVKRMENHLKTMIGGTAKIVDELMVSL